MVGTDDRSVALHPVVLPVPAAQQRLRGREKVAALRARAREALALSAGYAGLRLGPLAKDDNGAPLPSGGVYWSLSHKSACVAAVAALRPVGIDVERIKPVSAGLRRRIAEADEWAMAPAEEQHIFFRFWTAKEAVLKAVGTGLVELSQCRIAQVSAADTLLLHHGGRVFKVRQRWVDTDHLVAVTTDGAAIVWHITRQLQQKD